jgi:hypothetical protein
MKDQTELSRILSAVSITFGVKAEDVVSSSRKREHSLARHAVCRIAREQTNFTLSEVGEFLGGRDHATMLTSYRKSENGGMGAEFDEQLEKAKEILAQEMLVRDLGTLVYHQKVDEGKTPLTLVGLRQDSVELQNNNIKSWFPMSGLVMKEAQR